MNPKEKEDKSIHIPDGPLNKYGARLFIPKYIKILYIQMEKIKVKN